ncbi:hypothetical protein FNF28_04081 [Cafeteria roenbergensis]|uniref:Uncharacterized protein n=1 Tax=Cafeteria roenbergensis TaxID=33653 RepID=A0A5A8DGX4_CAFRO|nr:hypothetical protein FNF28_04081 [Cafeteria roenbergensis]
MAAAGLSEVAGGEWTTSIGSGLPSGLLEVTGEGRVVECTGTEDRLVLFSKSVGDGTSGAWEVLSEEDEYGDESTCIGIASADVCSAGAEAEHFASVRSMTGVVVSLMGTVVQSPLQPIHPGDRVRFSFDASARTLSAKINDKDFGVIVKGLPACKLFPAVRFFWQAKLKLENLRTGVLGGAGAAASSAGGHWLASAIPALTSEGAFPDNSGQAVSLKGPGSPICGFSTVMADGCWKWTVKLIEDLKDGEGSYSGIAAVGATQEALSFKTAAPTTWIKHSDGSCLGKGLATNCGSASAVHPGDTLSFQLDLERGTLSAAVGADASMVVVAKDIKKSDGPFVAAVCRSPGARADDIRIRMHSSPCQIASAARFSAGDRVRVKPSVSSPKYGWGPVSAGDVGTVKSVESDSRMRVDFPGKNSNWLADPSEMELAPAGSGAFSVGARVRVKPSVSSPKYGWGSVSAGDVGTVKSVESDSRMRVDFPGKNSNWLADPSEMELAPSGSGAFSVGARVRVKPSVSSPKYGWGSVSAGDVGTVKSVESDSRMRVDFPGKNSNWLADPSEMELAPAGSGAFSVGARVRVKPSVSSPKYGWGSVSAGDVGTVKSVESDSRMRVDFPGKNSNWLADPSEMELAPAGSGAFSVGARVRVKPSVSSPKYGWGSVSAGDVGTVKSVESDSRMRVDFPGKNSNWLADPSEMELAPAGSGAFSVGARVRVKPSVSSPKYGWGSVSAGDVGTVKSVESDSRMRVDFPGKNSNWLADPSEMELAPAGSGAFSPGDSVRVKPSVSSPKYGWGPVSAGDVGTVTGFDSDGDVLVHFPGKSSRWTGFPPEMELVSGGACAFAVGARVRVKPSVSSPKYGWGPVSAEDVGTIVRLDSDGDIVVNFPGKHSSWTGVQSEMELAPAGSGAFSVGARVRVKPSVSSPKYGWGSVSAGDVGTVKSVESDSRMRVDFPGKNSNWLADPSEMELAPAGSGAFSVGARVRVKPSVSSPSTGGGRCRRATWAL